jgi:aryl-alcohol dehydrogenase-like predicted oxidoreductase
VSPVGLGTVKLGRNTGVKYPASFELPGEHEVGALLAGALSLGVTLFDTAPAYGDSEQRLRPFLASHRARVVLSTKAGESYLEERSCYDFSPPALEASLQVSLQRMGVEQVDLLLLHSDGRDVELLDDDRVVDTLARLKSRGWARAVGISAKTPEGVLAARGKLDVVMAPYSAADPRLGDALRAAHDAGLGTLAIKGLASGHLAVGGDARRQVEAAVRFVVGQPFVDALVVGTLRLAHLQQAVEAAEGL